MRHPDAVIRDLNMAVAKAWADTLWIVKPPVIRVHPELFFEAATTLVRVGKEHVTEVSVRAYAEANSLWPVRFEPGTE